MAAQLPSRSAASGRPALEAFPGLAPSRLALPSRPYRPGASWASCCRSRGRTESSTRCRRAVRSAIASSPKALAVAAAASGSFAFAVIVTISLCATGLADTRSRSCRGTRFETEGGANTLCDRRRRDQLCERFHVSRRITRFGNQSEPEQIGVRPRDGRDEEIGLGLIRLGCRYHEERRRQRR